MAAPGVIVSSGLLAAALIVAVVGGFVSGSLLAGLVALAGAVVAGWGVWKGMQAETQTGAALSIVLLLVNVAFAGLMLLLKLVHAL
jgi:hypothetical protein